MNLKRLAIRPIQEDDLAVLSEADTPGRAHHPLFSSFRVPIPSKNPGDAIVIEESTFQRYLETVGADCEANWNQFTRLFTWRVEDGRPLGDAWLHLSDDDPSSEDRKVWLYLLLTFDKYKTETIVKAPESLEHQLKPPLTRDSLNWKTGKKCSGILRFFGSYHAFLNVYEPHSAIHNKDEERIWQQRIDPNHQTGELLHLDRGTSLNGTRILELFGNLNLQKKCFLHDASALPVKRIVGELMLSQGKLTVKPLMVPEKTDKKSSKRPRATYEPINIEALKTDDYQFVQIDGFDGRYICCEMKKQRPNVPPRITTRYEVQVDGDRILVIEDDKIALRLFGALVNGGSYYEHHAGYHVYSTGEQGIEVPHLEKTLTVKQDESAYQTAKSIIKETPLEWIKTAYLDTLKRFNISAPKVTHRLNELFARYHPGLTLEAQNALTLEAFISPIYQSFKNTAKAPLTGSVDETITRDDLIKDILWIQDSLLAFYDVTKVEVDQTFADYNEAVRTLKTYIIFVKTV